MRHLMEYLEQAAIRFPDKVAVASEKKQYTFAELRKQARMIAYVLKEKGVYNEPIGVIADRDVETLAFFFGILYSGNYYVPIDPDMPNHKKDDIFIETNMKYCFGMKKKLLKNTVFSGEFLGLQNGPEADLTENDTFCLIYTSGSTGKPKGILKTHDAEIYFLEHFDEIADYQETDVIGNQTPFYFDASSKDIYMGLKKGCTVEIIPTKYFSFPPDLVDYMNKRHVSCISWVPTAISLVAQMNTFTVSVPKYLRNVFFVGEVMPMRYLKKWIESIPARYVNLYGQTELCGICCYYEVKGDEDNLPVGKPIPGCHIYLIDETGNVITEAGREGELYIASPALAKEYYKTSNDAFMKKDFGNGLEKCFKTGDLARYDDDGNLCFSSRADFQIKHMGNRIELGEIEAIAMTLDDIQACCCVYNQEDKKLVLFCTSEYETDGQKIRSALRKILAEYMLPRKVVILDYLPTNRNGKIDRQRLKDLT